MIAPAREERRFPDAFGAKRTALGLASMPA
jgi:hypothetical protein